MIVLDTHVVIWRALAPEKIPAKIRKLLDAAEDRGHLCLCEISLLEVAMLVQRGRLATDLDARRFLDLVLTGYDYRLEGITPAIATTAMQFPETVNKDPANRVILATALHLGGRLATADANLRGAGIVPVVW